LFLATTVAVVVFTTGISILLLDLNIETTNGLTSSIKLPCARIIDAFNVACRFEAKTKDLGNELATPKSYVV